MENKAIEFYGMLQDNPICPQCGGRYKSLGGLGRHYKNSHNRHLMDWLFEVNPNYCKNCDNQIVGRVQDVYRRRFCSIRCGKTGEFNSSYGKPTTEEAKNKIRSTIKTKGERGLKLKEWFSKNSHPFKGKKHSTQSRLNMSSGRRRWYDKSYEGNFNKFCSSLRRSFNSSWRDPILRRDAYACQRCGNKRRLEVHHIKPYRDLILAVLRSSRHLSLMDYEDRWKLRDICAVSPDLIDMDNGVTLCRVCHNLKHRDDKYVPIKFLSQI